MLRLFLYARLASLNRLERNAEEILAHQFLFTNEKLIKNLSKLTCNTYSNPDICMLFAFRDKQREAQWESKLEKKMFQF